MTTPSAELLRHSAERRSGRGELIKVTSEDAGWEYTSLTVQRLRDGERWEQATGRNEVALVVLGGTCRVESAEDRWRLGMRHNVFGGQPSALYLPVETAYEVTADGPVEIAVCGARAEERFEPRQINPTEVAIEIRGAGNAARQINHILPPAFSAQRLLVVEVFTPSGNWSSYPPHKHDISNLPHEANLEEIYYYRIDPGEGFGLQRLYTEDGRIDEAWVIRNGDLLLVPEGYHTFVVAHGYTGYYLNVLAGNEAMRTMQPADDQDHGWVRGTWDPSLTSGIETWRDIDARINAGAGHRR